MEFTCPKVKGDEKILLKKRRGRPAKGERRFDLCRAVDLKLKGGMSIAEIAKFLNVQQNTVSYNFEKLRSLFYGDPEVMRLYERSRGDFLKRLQMAVGVEVFDAGKLKKASVNNLAYAFRQFFDCERLETGQSTQNITYADALKARDDALKAQDLAGAEQDQLRKDYPHIDFDNSLNDATDNPN